MFRNWFHDQSGQGLVEYVLVISLVAIVVVGILTVLGPQIGDIFSNIMEQAYCGECVCGTGICITPTPTP